MEYRTHDGLRISEVGVGCYALSGVYGAKDPAAYRQMLQRACGLGVNWFDTADAYGPAEEVLGEVLRPCRPRVHIASKVGARGGPKPGCLSRENVLQACEASLRRLQTDYIDLYQVHYDDPQTPVEETVAALDALVQQGKIRRYGLGHLPPARLEAYMAAGRIFSVMVELSAAAREALTTTLPLCQRQGVGAIAYSVTGRGLLTGRFQAGHTFEPGDIRAIDALFQRERFESGLRVTACLAEMGSRYGRTPAQMAIAWALAQPGLICALVGPSTVAHLEEDLGASGLRLAPDDLAEIKAFLQQEDAWLAQAQRASLRRILCAPLPGEPAQAFKDLVYAAETMVQLGLVAEHAVMPVFLELYGLRNDLTPGARPALERIQAQMAGLAHLDRTPPPSP
jgi:aryl-alcohol dehydrogenase-like predicted oxidoreductase